MGTAIEDEYWAGLQGGSATPMATAAPKYTAGSVEAEYWAGLEAAENAPEKTRQPRPQATTFLGRTGDRLGEAGDVIADSFTRAGNPLDPGAVPRRIMGGAVIPAIGDIAGDAMVTAGKEILPDAVVNSIGKAAEYIGESAPVQALGRGLASWREASPATYELAGDTANILMAATPIKGMPKTNLKMPPPITAGAKSRAKLKATLAKQRTADTRTLLEPDNFVDAKGRVTEQGRLGKQVYEPTPREVAMYDAVEAIEGVDPRRSNLHNLNAVDAEVKKLATGLDDALATANDIPLPVLTKDIEDAITAAGKSPTLVGDAEKVANRIYDKFAGMLSKVTKDGAISPKDLLQARRDLDSWVRDSGGEMFDNNANARSVAVSKIRQTINDRVAAASPSVDVKGSLEHQFNLLSGRDLLHERAAKEARTGLKRAVQKVEKDSGLLMPRTPQAAHNNARIGGGAGLTTLATLKALGGGKSVPNALRRGRTRTLEGLDMATKRMPNSVNAPLSEAALKALMIDATNRDER